MTKTAPAVRASSTQARAQGAPFFDKCYRYEEADRIKKAGVYTFFRAVGSAQDPEVTIDGRRMVMLGLQQLPGPDQRPSRQGSRHRRDPQVRLGLRRQPVLKRHA